MPIFRTLTGTASCVTVGGLITGKHLGSNLNINTTPTLLAPSNNALLIPNRTRVFPECSRIHGGVILILRRSLHSLGWHGSTGYGFAVTYSGFSAGSFLYLGAAFTPSADMGVLGMVRPQPNQVPKKSLVLGGGILLFRCGRHSLGLTGVLGLVPPSDSMFQKPLIFVQICILSPLIWTHVPVFERKISSNALKIELS